MNKRPDFKSFKAEILKNSEVRKEYEALRPEFELMMELIQIRKSANPRFKMRMLLSVKKPKLSCKDWDTY